jgi:pilus assembly protein CpaC
MVWFSASAVRAQPPARPSDSFHLEVGEQHVLPAGGVKSYSEGTPGVIDVRLTGDASKFVVVGRNQGTTTLLFIMFDGTEKIYNFQVGDEVVEGAATQVNDLAVQPQANIRLDLYFIQIDRTRALDLGMNMPSTLGFFNLDYSYNLAASTLASNSAVIGTQFLPQLAAAQSRGWAKLSRHVAVITTNGQPASFNSGGEFNAVTAGGLGQNSVLSVKYGSRVNVTPRYDKETGRIELNVSAEVSDLAATSSSVPGRSVSSVQTVSNLALGESLAVAGLNASTQSRTRGGLPWLSQIPVIGLLFGKQTDTYSDTENLVFIAPSVVDPLKPARAREFLSSAMQEFEEYTGAGKPRGVFPGTVNALQGRGAPAADRSQDAR